MVYSGRLTEKLKFFRPVTTTSDSGFKTSSIELLFEVNAERLKNKENFVVDGQELFHSVSLTFRLRNRKEINELCTVEYNGERYRIISLDRWKMENEITIVVEKINE